MHPCTLHLLNRALGGKAIKSHLRECRIQNALTPASWLELEALLQYKHSLYSYYCKVSNHAERIVCTTKGRRTVPQLGNCTVHLPRGNSEFILGSRERLVQNVWKVLQVRTET